MTTIAIIGGGIAARSLLFTIAKNKISAKILVFYSDNFAFPCSLHSTAIVAPRGVTTGLSPLGDHLFESFERFERHVDNDHPNGVIFVPQYTGVTTKIDEFKKRYPFAVVAKKAGSIDLSEQVHLIEERAYLIRPSEYLDWLLTEAKKSLDFTVINSFVTQVKDGKITTTDGYEYSADKIIFTAGVQNDLWQEYFPIKKSTKSVQGSYLEFSGVKLTDSFSLTLEGDNLIYDKEKETLLLGSTTRESRLELSPEKELLSIYQDFSKNIGIDLPAFSSGEIKIGLREKASKREPYLLQSGIYSMIGGFYKNGYRVSLSMAERLLNSL